MTSTTIADTTASPLLRLSSEPLGRLVADEDAAAVVRRVIRQAQPTGERRSPTVDIAAFGSAI